MHALHGITGVIDRIMLKPQARPSTAEIKMTIEDALKRLARLDAGKILVEVSDGTVVLRGKADSPWQKEKAEAAARAAPQGDSVLQSGLKM